MKEIVDKLSVQKEGGKIHDMGPVIKPRQKDSLHLSVEVPGGQKSWRFWDGKKTFLVSMLQMNGT